MNRLCNVCAFRGARDRSGSGESHEVEASGGAILTSVIRRATRRFTRAEYGRLVEEKILRPGERVELLNGEIVAVTPQGARHAHVVYLLARALERAIGETV